MEEVEYEYDVLNVEDITIEVKQNNNMTKSTESFEEIETPPMETFTNIDEAGNEVNQETESLPEHTEVSQPTQGQHQLGVSVTVNDIDLIDFGITESDIHGNHLELIEIYNDNPALTYKILHDIRKEPGGKRKIMGKWRSKKQKRNDDPITQSIPNTMSVLEVEAESHNRMVHSTNGNPEGETTTVDAIAEVSTQEVGITSAKEKEETPTTSRGFRLPEKPAQTKTVTPGGAADSIILTMLYVEPIKSAAPVRAQKLPMLTESYNRNAQGYASASPILWTEGLNVLTLDTSGTSRCATEIEAVQTVVSSGKRYPLPGMSTIGMQISELTGSSLASTGMRAFMSPSNTLDIMSVTTLLEIARNEGEVWSQPEDIFLRMNLLRLSLVPPSWYIHNTNIHRRMAINAKMAHIKPEDDVWNMLPAPAATDATICAIGKSSSSIDVLLLTLTQYLKNVIMGTGGYMPNTTEQVIVPTEHIVIPISSNDLKKPASWMVPYVIAHTSTHWYNMSMTFNATITPTKTSTADAFLKMMVMNKACTVEVHKKFKLIIFVIIDCADPQYDNTRCLLISSVYDERIKNNGNKYSKLPELVYKWLGRITPKFGNQDADCAMAARRICEYYNCQGLKKKCESMAVELAFKVPMPFSCTQPDVEGSEIVELHGPTAYNDSVTIGSCKLKTWDSDFASGTKAAERIMALNDWSISPYGLFPSVHFVPKYEDFSPTNTNEKKYAGMKEWKNMSAVYNVSATSTLDTLILAIGIYLRDKDCNNDTFETNVFFANEMRARSVLVHAVLTNILVNSGITIADWNFWDSTQYDMPPDIFKILPSMTLGFISATNEVFGRRLIEEETWRTQIKDLMGFTGTGDVQIFYYMPFPIWFVRDVMCKFTKTFQDAKFPPLAIQCGYGDASNIYDARPGGFMGWRFLLGDDPMAFNLLTATTNYECDAIIGGKGFAVYTPNSHFSMPEKRAIGWYPYLFNDRLLSLETTASSAEFYAKVYKKMYNEGIILTTSVTLPLQVSLIKHAPIQFGVSGRSHVNPDIERSIIKNLGRLTWPDPFFEWLLRGIKDVGLEFLDKGPTSALIKTITHIAEPIVSWVDKWERDNWMPKPTQDDQKQGTFRP